MSAPPFFILGTQRSGTTLLYQMLNVHPRLYVVNEFWDLYPHLTGEIDDRAALEALLIRHLGLTSSYLAPGESRDRAPFDHLDSAFARKLEETGKQRWGIKHPRLLYHVDLFLERYPDARFVFIIRDPRGVVRSYLTRKWNVANVFHGAKLWRDQVRLQQAFIARNPDRCHVLHFERLLEDPRAEVTSICRFLDEPFDERLLEYYRERPDTWIHDGNANITQPIERSIGESWRQHLSRRQIAIVEGITEDVMRAEGYAPESEPIRVGSLERLAYDVHQWMMTTYWWQRRSGWSGVRRLFAPAGRER
jgi:hypothetical protein